MKVAFSLAACLVAVFCLAPLARAAGGFEITENRAEADFPDSVTFYLEASAQEEIEEIELEYAALRTSCGSASAKARPEFDPAKQVQIDWTWSFAKSNSPPPGAQIWWRWHVWDKAGNEYTVEKETIVFDDPNYDWQETASEELVLLAATADQAVPQALWQAANEALVRLESEVGARPERPVTIYVYPSPEALREAVVYTQEWTGGLAFTSYDTILLGVNRSSLEWGKGTTVHELTHVVVHQLTFNCAADIPRWLDEGLATYIERDPAHDAFDEALSADTLFSLQTLASGFPTDSRRANLAYQQSHRVVGYLIETYGGAKMRTLLDVFQEGTTVDGALERVYGVDVAGLDNEWRVSLGLAPREIVATPTLTRMITLVPYGVGTATPTATAAPSATPTAAPSATATATPTQTPTPTPRVKPTLAPTYTPLPTQVAPSRAQDRTPWLGWAIGIVAACVLALVGGGLLILRQTGRRD